MPAPDGQQEEIQLRRDTAGDWSSVDPVLAQGEVGLVMVAGVPTGEFKIGDGTAQWSDLPLFPHAAPQPISSQGGASYTVQMSDVGTLIRGTRATAQTIVLPVDIPIGSHVEVVQDGAGTITFDDDGTSVIHSAGELRDIAEQHAGVTCVVVAADEWRIFGSLA